MDHSPQSLIRNGLIAFGIVWVIIFLVPFCQSPEDRISYTHPTQDAATVIETGETTPVVVPAVEPLLPVPEDLQRQLDSGALRLASAVVAPAQPPAEVVASAVDPGCVRAIVAFMQAQTVTPRGALAFKRYEGKGTQLVFRRGNARYTLYEPGHTEGFDPWLAYWERLEGTTARENVITYSDRAFTGFVDFGIGDDLWRQFRSGRDNMSPPEGLEHWPFWQARYRWAVHATILQFHLSCNPAP